MTLHTLKQKHAVVIFLVHCEGNGAQMFVYNDVISHLSSHFVVQSTRVYFFMSKWISHIWRRIGQSLPSWMFHIWGLKVIYGTEVECFYCQLFPVSSIYKGNMNLHMLDGLGFLEGHTLIDVEQCIVHCSLQNCFSGKIGTFLAVAEDFSSDSSSIFDNVFCARNYTPVSYP